ncbi:MAG: hypothetical protein ABSF78_10770 [Candidatus Acidiferrales bacterium]
MLLRPTPQDIERETDDEAGGKLRRARRAGVFTDFAQAEKMIPHWVLLPG